jgi:mTERF domain-containing protein
VDDVKDLGFNPSKITFSIALIAKASVTKTLWKEKVDAFKKWGWSDEDALEAFRKKPYCMLTSIDKINLVMSFWVNQMGWDAMAIAKKPYILTLSLEKRIIPRAAVVQFLLNKGLINKNASLTNLFVMTEKLFLDMLIRRFKNESSYLLKLYEEKRNHA